MQIKNRFITQAVTTGLSVLCSLGGIQAFGQTDISSRYRFVTLDHPGALITYPLGINSRGDIAGYYLDGQFQPHGFVYKRGQFSEVEYPGAALTAAAGINDLGDVSGTYFDTQGFQHGYLMTMPDGCGSDNDDRWARCQPTFESIDFPGAAQTTGIPFESGTGLGTSVTGLNNRREVAGLYATSGGYSNGFVFSARGGFQSTDAPNASHTPSFGTRFFGVNDLGVMVGDYISQSNPQAPPINHGFLLCGDEYTPIFVTGSDLGGFGTQVNGVNDFRMAVGLFSDPMGQPHGFLWADGTAYQLNYPAALYTESHAISNLGVITGSYSTDRTGLSIHGYVAYPKGW